MVSQQVEVSDDEQRYAKRSRLSSVAPSSTRQKERRSRHPEWWLLDGSVIIQIDDVMFRLHRSRLAQLSEYFSQRFKVPEYDSDVGIEEQLDQLDGLPVFKVRETTVSDFEELLTALDNAM